MLRTQRGVTVYTAQQVVAFVSVAGKYVQRFRDDIKIKSSWDLNILLSKQAHNLPDIWGYRIC